MSIEISREKHVLTASVNRPDAMNAINFDVIDRLEKLLTEIEDNDDLRLFVFTGSGNSFVSGGDLKEFHQLNDAESARKMTLRMISILNRIKKLPVWTLAAINGHTYGGGWEIALAFDFRVVRSDAKIGFTQGKFYLPPGWGGNEALTQSVGKNQALYWLASHKVIDADTAYRTGFVQDLFDKNSYEDQLQKLQKNLTLNDQTFINYLKGREKPDTESDADPFSKFWISNEHRKRVEKFLKRKR